MFDKDEMAILNECIQKDDILKRNAYSVADGEGRGASLAIWDYLSDDTYGNFMRSQRIYKIVSGLMNNAPIQHYHTKFCYIMNVDAMALRIHLFCLQIDAETRRNWRCF